MVHLGPKKPPLRKGTFEGLPQSFLKEIEHYETLFTVDKTKLKSITDHFVKELEKGLSKEGGSIPMNVAWVMDYPTGKETGTYLALDMGGTNLRVAQVTLDGNRSFDVVQSKYRLPDHIKVGKADDLWDFIADCVDKFLKNDCAPIEEDRIGDKVFIGFTFSYPCLQSAINHGILQRWTKGFDIKGVEGHDVVPMVQKAFERKNLKVQIGALINDTTGTLVASNYVDENTQMGCIFGTGCNAAYYEKVKNIPKLEGLCSPDIHPDSWMAINCEYGAFDNEHVVLPRTKFDVQIDLESPRPNQQSFEKMIAGCYLGELLRLVLLELTAQNLIFQDQDLSKLETPYYMDASFLSQIEDDPWENLGDTEVLFRSYLGIETTEPERVMIRRIVELIGTRAARLSMCGIAAMSKKMGYKSANAGADGSVYNKYPHFKQRGAQALADIFDWDMAPSKYPIKVVPAEDGSGIGAAVIAALTRARFEKGLSLGVAKKK